MPPSARRPPRRAHWRVTHGCCKEVRFRKDAEGPARQQDGQGRQGRPGTEPKVTPLPPWHFPVPVRRSRFRAAGPEWTPFNIQVALDRISPFDLDGRSSDDILLCDYHAPLEGGLPGRLGSGRSGVYRGKYLKGVGRTLAAANWNDGDDRYHGSGHMSVGSALRERLITREVQALGLGRAIVPCEAVLLRPLSSGEQQAVHGGASSSTVDFTPADASLAALTVKPGDFARFGNIVFALTYFDNSPQWLGRFFLEFDRYLRPPGSRVESEGTPAEIVDAMDVAFRHGLANFQAFGRAGLLWVFIVGNVSLDGRVLDLETPHYFGAPFVGMRTPLGAARSEGTFVGFEELALAASWRRFLAWMLGRLDWMASPTVMAQPEARAFLRSLASAIRRRFSSRHLLHDNRALTTRAVANLQTVWNLPRRDEARLRVLAEHAAGMALRGLPDTTPRTTWTPITPAPAPPTPTRFHFESPAFLPCTVTREAVHFAQTIVTGGAEQDLRRLLRTLA